MELIANQMGKHFPRAFACGVRVCELAMLLLASGVCSAGRIEKLAVTHSDGEYRLEVVSELNVPTRYAYDVITDYQHAYRLNPAIVEVDVLPGGREGAVRVRNRSEHWFGPFYFHIDWIGEIQSPNPGPLEVVTIPENSSFESGHALWTIRSQGEGTLVEYQSRLKPKFFIPPVIGEMIMENRIREETLTTFQRIECQARLQFELDLEQDPEYVRQLIEKRDQCIRTGS
jgi:hypothetical protein